MGNDLNSDQKLRVCLRLDNSVYYAGDMVTGTVFIQAFDNRPYQFLYLSLICNEHCYWTQKHGKHTTSYSQERQTYREQFVLAKFNYGINNGQYAFPFSILLPANLPASMQMGGNNFIRNTLRAYLPPFDGSSKMQAFDYKINLREPLRFQAPLMTDKIYGSSTCCCNCCCDCCCKTYMMGSSQFQLDKNIINYNETINFRGLIDNTAGDQTIDGYKIVLFFKTTKQATSKSRSCQHQAAVLYNFVDKIYAGQKRQISVPIRIPNHLTYHTAIGSIIARQFYISLVTGAGCCYNDSFNKKHIIITNQFGAEQPEHKEIAKILSNFSPSIRQQPISFVNLRPYIYTPSFAITDHNQLGTIVGNMNAINPMSFMNMFGNSNQNMMNQKF